MRTTERTIPPPAGAPPAAAFRRWARRGLLGALVVLGLSSCAAQFRTAQQPPESCSRRRLNAAATLYEEAKEFLELHFKERHNSSLVFAYYASRDAEALARTIRGCPDFESFRRRGVDLIRANRIFRRVVRLNMRDPDPMVLMHILGPAYDEIIKSDIK